MNIPYGGQSRPLARRTSGPSAGTAPHAQRPAVGRAEPNYPSSSCRTTRVWKAQSDVRSKRYAAPLVAVAAAIVAIAGIHAATIVPNPLNAAAPRQPGARDAGAGPGGMVEHHVIDSPMPADRDLFVTVSKDRRVLTVYRRVKSVPVAVGRSPGDKRGKGDNRTPETPVGAVFPITRKLRTDPTSQFGSRYMELSTPPWNGIAIHGTNDASSVGTMASHGCVRMHNPDVEWLFEVTRPGDPVVITR
jgi:lipoprotein-anchoring transpeptidase ErfK/SrfK